MCGMIGANRRERLKLPWKPERRQRWRSNREATVSVSNQETVFPYVGNGVTVTFAYNCQVQKDSDLDVYVNDLPVVSGITKNGIGSSSGGSVTFAIAPAIGDAVRLERVVELERTTDYQQSGDFLSPIVNSDFDRIWMALQQFMASISRALRFPNSDINPNTVLPSAADRANKLLGFDANGSPTVFIPSDQSATALQFLLAQPNGVDLVGGAAKSSDLAASSGSSLFGFIQSIVGSILRTGQDKMRDVIDARDIGILANGTDQTAIFVTRLTALGVAGFRGPIRVAYGTKFNAKTVYAAVPVGIVLEDWSSINFGQPPSYKNKFMVLYSGDSVSDDTQDILISGHHPTRSMNNLGTAGTTSGNARYCSNLYQAGIRWSNDPITGIQQLFSQSTSNPAAWRMSWILGTSPLLAINSKQWVPGIAAVNGVTYVDTAAGNAYIAASTGTTGATIPSHTSGTVSDGGVSWTYVSKWDQGATRWFFQDDGSGAIIGPSTASWTLTTNIGSQQFVMSINGTTADCKLTDTARNVDVLSSSTTKGTRLGGVPSIGIPTKSGATPTASDGGMYVNNPGATNMTNILLPTGQNEAFQTLWFANANTTVKAGSFILKGGIDVTPPANGIMRFMTNSAISSAWVEVSRSF